MHSDPRVSGDAVSVVDDPSSQITVFTGVSQEKEKELDNQYVKQPIKEEVCNSPHSNALPRVICFTPKSKTDCEYHHLSHVIIRYQ